MVTAEMAVSLITATMAVIAGVWAVSLVIVHDACRVTASRDGWIRVTVSTDRSLGKIGPVHLQASAAAPQEPGELK